MTPLKKHRGHPGFLALAMIAATGTVVWLDVHRKPATRGVTTEYSIAPKLSPSEPGTSARLPAPSVEKTVVMGPRERIVTATGTIGLDGTKTDRIIAPFDGLLVRARRSWLGKAVRPGEVLAVMYSRDVYDVTEKLIDAVAKNRPQPEIDRLRYQLMGAGMAMETVSTIERGGVPTSALPIATHVGGRVIAEPRLWWPMVQGERTPLFTVTDPGRYTVYVELPDADAARTSEGMPATLTLEGVNKPVASKVTHVWRRSERGMRTVQLDVYLPREKVVDGTAVTARFDYGP